LGGGAKLRTMPPERRGVRQTGGFAKRNAVSSKLSRKIGWLNSHGNLQDEIRFIEVKDVLQRTGDDEAMMILQNLEKKAKEIQNPTGYILNSAKNSLDRGRRQPRARPARERRGRSGPVPEPDQPPKDRWKEEAPEEGLQDSGQEVEDAPMVDHEEPELPEDSAVNMDEDNIDKAEGAAQLEDQMRLLNSNAGLQKELDIEQLLEPLSSLGVSQGLKILSHLEEKAAEVRDPTAYIMRAARQRGKGKSKGGEERRGKGVIKTHLKERKNFDPALVEKVKKRISWLNDKANLADTLSYDKVGEVLLGSGPIAEVMKILKTLEENASEVRNPNGYIVSAARRLQEEGVAPEPKSSKPSKQDFRDEPLEKQLEAHIVWLNREIPLNAPLDFDRVSSALLSIDTADAGEILRRLEESAKEVRDPNSYVLKAAQRVLDGERPDRAERSGKGGRRGERREVPEPPPPLPPRPAATAEDDKIAKRVNWLNGHANLASPLDFDRLVSSFRSIGYYQSLEVLNNLEEHASTVRDPTAYVMSGIRKMTEGSGGGGGSRPSTSAPALPAPPAKGERGKGANGEEKLRRKIEWLNNNVCKNDILKTDRVLPALLALPNVSQAFDVLKNFEENCNNVRDPTAYAIGTARKAGKGESIGTGRTPKVPEPPLPSRAPRAKGEGRPAEPIGSFGGSRSSRDAQWSSQPSDGRIRRQIRWLNKNANLSVNLDEDKVSPQLAKVGDREAMDILKRLEENASTVRDPTGYVIAALRRSDGKGRNRK